MRRFSLGLLTAVLVVGCTDVELMPAVFPVEVTGEYCTEAASSYGVPIRIMLVIDTSASMQANDPAGYRAAAAADLITGFGDHDDVAFGLIEFNTAATMATQGFVRDPAVLSGSLNQLNKMEGFTNYIDALALAEAMINDDLALVRSEIQALEAAGQSTRFARPWYFVVFLSDGIPRMPGGVLQDTDQILWRVEQLVDVPPEAAGVVVHTAFLGAEDDTQRADAEALLEQMAQVGGGSYTSFESGEEIDFSLFDFEVKRLFDIKQFVVYNSTAVLGTLTTRPDTDADGIDDIEEEEMGIDPLHPDSDGDGCDDGFEVAAGFDPLGGYCPCTGTEQLRDTDHDGLSDCEESFLGYDANRFDSDGDLFPDAVELRFGTNAADSIDWKEDLDFDGVLTGAEIRQGTNPTRDDRDMHERFAYRYRVERAIESDAQVCYRFSVENVTLTQTGGLAGRAAGVNELVFEVIESPEDAAEEVFTLRRFTMPISIRAAEGGKRAGPTADDFQLISRQDLAATE